MAKKDGSVRVLQADVLDSIGKAVDVTPYRARERVKTKPGKDRTNITYFVTLGTHKRMKQYALDNNTSLQQMLDEAVDLLFAAKGEQPIEKTGAKE